MRRATVHGIFAGLASIFLLLTLWQAYALKKNQSVVDAIGGVPAKITETIPMIQLKLLRINLTSLIRKYC